MKNLVFISPNFPTNYWMFCKELKNNGLNVLGIGDQPYDEMTQDQRDSLTEYYKVDSLEDRDAVYRAVAFFIHKYGRIDWLESNNEYWLEGDAQLRTAYNITSGFQAEDMNRIKYKSRMKESYIRAGIPVARYHLADKVEGGLAFAQEVGYPIVAKPDNGVGASHTFKINNDDEMRAFYDAKWTDTQYIMEEFIHGEINSYDAIIDSHGEPLFETGNVTPSNLMEVVNNMDNSIYYIQKDLPDDVRKAGRATVKSFGVKSRFVHFEFFRLLSDHSHLGKKGDVVALEVNMRPCGGFTPDMINFAYSTNVYKIWADMIAFDHSTVEVGQHEFCAYAGLRDGKNFVMTHSDIMDKYGYCMRMVDRIPDALAGAMANKMYVATFPTREGMDQFYADLLAMKED